jgi:hypothetical protein
MGRSGQEFSEDGGVRVSFSASIRLGDRSDREIKRKVNPKVVRPKSRLKRVCKA